MSDPPAVYWVRVEAPHFVAALKIENERCIGAAPILSWAIGTSADELRAWFKLKRWTATRSRVAPKGVAR
jgi:hypothetical protein